MKNGISLRMRVSRFLEERSRYGEGPVYVAELVLWGFVIILASWPVLLLAAAAQTLR
jgi:hypothetical protein